MKNKYVSLLTIFLAVFSFFTFSSILDNDFINFDDTEYLTENTQIKSGINLKSIQWAFTAVVSGNWHPLTLISHALDWSMFGANASGHHLINLILHIGSALILFLFLDRTTKASWPSFFVAAFFALHPLRVESVAWASERKDVLSMFLGMASIYAYAFYAESRKPLPYIFCLAFFAMSLMAKSLMVTLPFLFLLLDHWPLGRQPDSNRFSLKNNFSVTNLLWKEKVPFFLLSVIISVITIWSQNKSGMIVPLEDWPVSGRFFNIIIAYVAYLKNIFWPADLAVFYPFELPFVIQEIFNNLFFLIITTAFVLLYFKKKPFLCVGWFWYLGTFIPMIGLVQIASQSMADRYTYFPSIGIAIILVWGTVSVIHKEKIMKTVLFAAGGTVLVILALLTWKQCGYWQNSTSLFRHTLHVTRNNAQAHHNLGLALFQEGNIHGATYHYSRAIHIQPDALGYFNRALAYASINHIDQAINDFTNAIEQKPDCAVYYNHRGIAYSKIEDYQKAIADFSKAILLNSDDVSAYNNRANAYIKQGNIDAGCLDAQKACTLGNCKTLNSAKETGQCR